MATKTQKKTQDLQSKICDSYIDFVLSENKEPSSVYAFAKHLNISESEFYQYFNQFSDIESYLWKKAAVNTIQSLVNSDEYQQYNTNEKVLGFFYTLIESIKNNRSYFVYSFKKNQPLHKNLSAFKAEIEQYAKQVIQMGLDSNELESRKLVSDQYYNAVWLNTLFILNFWVNDNSRNFEKTDAAIEKSANLMLELMGKSALDSFIDFGKFLFQNIKK